MVRQLKSKIGGDLGAGAMLFIAVGVLLCHTLACTESPMSFAPSGDLAFTTMVWYDHGETVALRGGHCYRLMVLPKDANEVKLLEESTDYMISAPAFSPDGKKVAYLRIPLASPEEFEKVTKAVKERMERMEPASQPVTGWPKLPMPPSEANAATTQPYSGVDRTAPPIAETTAFATNMFLGPSIECQLVERDLQTGKAEVKRELSTLLKFEKDPSSNLVCKYILSRLQYDPSGQWIYVNLGDVDPGDMVYAVNIQKNEVIIVAAPSTTAILSPDGKTLAVLQEKYIGFVKDEGKLATYVSWEAKQPAGMTWVDSKTVALLGQDANNQAIVSYMTTDGAIKQTKNLPGVLLNENKAVLTASANGKNFVIADDKKVYFLDGKGKILNVYENSEKLLLAQPTFTPDGKAVAFKLMKEKEKEEEKGRRRSSFSVPTARSFAAWPYRGSRRAPPGP